MSSSRRASRSNAGPSGASEAGPSTANPTVSAQHDEAMIGQEGEDAGFGQQNQEEESESLGEEADVIPGALEGSMPVEGDEEEEEEEEEEEYESTSQSGTDSLTWISWYCSLAGHEYFAEVSEDFIEDDFNLTGLSQLVPFYKEALEMILDVEPEEETLKIPDMSIVESSAELLYGLIHQRYIITRQGLSQMVAKYEAAHFGYCPRVYCNQTKVLPSGRSDLPGVDGVKLFCPTCVDTYTPPSSRFNGVDGAFFGTTFPHLLFQQHPELVPTPPSANAGKIMPLRTPSASPGPNASSQASPATTQDTPTPASPTANSNVDMLDDDENSSVPWTKPETSAMKLYIPRIYGFKVSERARSGPRMQWLRLKPRDERELDRVNSAGTWKSSAALLDPQTTTSSTVKSEPSPLFSGATGTQLPANATASASQVRPIRSRQKLETTASPAVTTSAPTNVDDQVAPRRAQNIAATATSPASAATPSRGRRP